MSEAELGAWSAGLSPLLQYKLDAAFFPRGPGCEVDLRALTKQRLYALLGELERELSASSELRHVGRHLLDHPEAEAQRLGCIWLTLFPDAETMERVARVALDETRTLEVRDQAAWTLCFRQRQTRHPSLYFAPEAEAIADAALFTLLDRGGLGTLPQLAEGLRHVCAPDILDFLARDVVAAKDAIECFATPVLARAAFRAAFELDSGAGTRAIRLASSTLGEELVPELLAALATAPTLAHRFEAAQCLASLDPSTLGSAERAVRQDNPFPEASLRLVRHHAAHPHEFATVRGLEVARRTATLAPDQVGGRCRRAAEPLLEYAGLAYAANHVHVEFLAYLVHAAGDAALVLRLFDQFAELFGAEREVLPAPLAALAGSGRFSDLERLARARGEFARGGWELARHGRPFRALALLSAVPEPNIWSTAARALALFTAGRPDLAQQVFLQALPMPALHDTPFPGAEERYQLARAPGQTPLGALVRRAPHELLAYVVPSPPNADPDRVDMSLLFAEAAALFSAPLGSPPI